MAKEKKEKKQKLTKKYRLVVMEDDTHKNLFAIRSTRLILTIGSCATLLLLLVMILLLISYTPIKEFIPGYPSSETRHNAIQNAAIVDSLEKELELRSLQLTNIQRIITGKKPLGLDSLLRDTSRLRDGNLLSIQKFAKEDSLLREEVAGQEKFNLSSSNTGRIVQIEGLLFFPPVKGVVTQFFNPAIGHPFIDIAAPSNSIVSSILDGTVIASGWNDDTGFTIQIQHNYDLISFYKHNSKILKKVGDKVTAGSPIALVGDSGKLSTGAHLHFELWHKGEPIDPTKYINF